jgi:transmembrane sensor
MSQSKACQAKTAGRRHFLLPAIWWSIMSVRNVSALNQANAWQRGKLIFRDQPLTEVVAELNRYARTHIVLKGAEIGRLRVSGVFPIDDAAVLGALQKAFPIRSARLGPWLVILYS